MDLRTKRTKHSIINAFINKATFYSHYHDIYDLSEQLENEAIDTILKNIPHPEEFVTKPKQATPTLSIAFFSQNRLIDILFSGSRTSILVNKLDERIKHKIYTVYPEYKNNLEWNVLLTFLIQGGFYAFLSHSKQMDSKHLIDIVGEISEHALLFKAHFPSEIH